VAFVVWVVGQDQDHVEVPVAVCQAPASTWTSTLASAVLSAATPVTVAVPETVAPAEGEEKLTDGAVVSALDTGGVVSAVAFWTVTVRDVVAVLPLLSVLRAVRVWVPLTAPVVLQVHDHDAVPVAVCQVPVSTDTSTRARPTSSAALPATATSPATVAPADGVDIETVGGAVSQGLRQLAA
jgi:hypothetical protein